MPPIRLAEKRLTIDQIPELDIPEHLTVSGIDSYVNRVSRLSFPNVEVSGTTPEALINIPVIRETYPHLKISVVRNNLSAVVVKEGSRIMGSDRPIMIEASSDLYCSLAGVPGFGGPAPSIIPIVSDKWYYLWILYVKDNTYGNKSVHLMFYDSYTSPPPIPSGYTLLASRRISAARTYFVAGSDIRILGYNQFGCNVIYWGDYLWSANLKSEQSGSSVYKINTYLQVISRFQNGLDINNTASWTLAGGTASINSFSFLFGEGGHNTKYYPTPIHANMEHVVPPSAENGLLYLDIMVSRLNTIVLLAPAKFPEDSNSYPKGFRMVYTGTCSEGTQVTTGGIVPVCMIAETFVDGSFSGKIGVKFGVATSSPAVIEPTRNRDWLIGICTGYTDVL